MKKISLFILSFTLLSCSDSESPASLTTTDDGVHYHNEQFQLSVRKPESWYAQDTKELMAIQQSGSELVAGDDEGFKKILEESLKTSVPLFGFYESKPGTPSESHASIVAVAENISAFPELKKGCDYLNSAKQLLAQSQLQVHFEQDCHTQVVNGSRLSFFNAQVIADDRIINQTYMACISGDYAITMVATNANKSEASGLDAILASLNVHCDEE